MAAVTKNRNVFGCQFLLYYNITILQYELKFELQLHANMAMGSLTYIQVLSVRFVQPVYSV
jgi:hypothetical protein